MRIGSLCSGYGGLDLAVEALTGAETVWHSEFNKSANKVYETHWQNPNLGDLTKIEWGKVPKVDIITGGYPCQPFSKAGKREGINDKKHIFPYIANAIQSLQPKWVFLENVRGHLSLGFDSVLHTLTEIGYDTRWTLARASDIGACHRRERLFIIAERSDTSGERLIWKDAERSEGQPQFKFNGLGFASSDTLDNQLPRNGEMSGLGSGHNSRSDVSELQEWGRYQTAISRWEKVTRPAPAPLVDDKLSAKFTEWMMGLPEGWVTDVDISRNQQMKMLGNGVVPQQAYAAYRKLSEVY